MACLKETLWKPLDSFQDKNTVSSALIILNQPIDEKNEGFLKLLWSKSSVRLCADGAANRLYEWSIRHNFELNYVPDYICGDLDSLRPEVKEFYIKFGCKVVRLHNQDLTDFLKTLKFSINCLKNSKFDKDLFDNENCFKELNLKQVNFEYIYILCNFSGRLDHSLANLNTLYKINLVANNDKYVKIFMVSEESVTFLLNEGMNHIDLSNNRLCGTYCGLFPLNKASIVTTKGLKWNFTNQQCSFDDLISSSNEFDLTKNDNSSVFIETDNPILWTMSIQRI
jgi:thiamine pyrophosphokinase